MGMVKRWRGLKSLVHDAVDATTELVGEGHESTARNVRRVTDQVEELRGPASAVDSLRRVATRGVLGSIKLVNRTVEAVTDAGLDLAEATVLADLEAPAVVPMREDVTRSATWVSDAAMALVNAAVGDHLEARGNGLGIEMQLRVGDRYAAPDVESIRNALADTDASPKLAVFVHGLGTTEWSWCLEAEAYHGDPAASFGTLLARDLGFTSLFVRYNTGRHISENGRALADLLDALVEASPVPIEDLTLVGHSMGGLVVRSACAHAPRPFAEHVRRVFYLGSPHRGAPLAKLAHTLDQTLSQIDLPGTRITSRILHQRSHGIADLRHGAVVDEDWLAPLPEASNGTPLLDGAEHYFVSATVTRDAAHPVGALIGDLLVRVPSASGPDVPARETHFPIEVRHEGGVMHHQLQNHPAVYAQLKAACERPTE
ncbi:MAG: esterase/lipase family protein [Sandaracinaceae bacterium]